MKKNILTVDKEENEIRLSERSTEIDVLKQSSLQRSIVTDLKQTLKANENLIALSAPAIGEQRRIFCIRFKEEIKTFINPVITEAKGLELNRETCSSIPGKTYLVPRNNDLTVVYQKPMGKVETRQFIGQAAFVFQHEVQHLDGLTIADIGLEIDEEFDNATEEDKQEIIKMYLDSLDIKYNDVQKEINNDKELKQISDAIDFMTSVYKGETKIEGYNDKEDKNVNKDKS